MPLWKVGNKIAGFQGKHLSTKVTAPHVHIGEHDYEIVKIGNRYWIAENFYEPIETFAGTGSAANKDTCWADFTNKNNSRGLGMLYYTGGFIDNYNSCRDRLNALLAGTGFRLPTYNDCEDLLRVSADWHDYMTEEYGGNDSLGFHGRNSGASARDWNYVNWQTATYMFQILCDDYYNTFTFTHPDSSHWMTHENNYTAYRYAIRLCANI